MPHGVKTYNSIMQINKHEQIAVTGGMADHSAQICALSCIIFGCNVVITQTLIILSSNTSSKSLICEQNSYFLSLYSRQRVRWAWPDDVTCITIDIRYGTHIYSQQHVRLHIYANKIFLFTYQKANYSASAIKNNFKLLKMHNENVNKQTTSGCHRGRGCVGCKTNISVTGAGWRPILPRVEQSRCIVQCSGNWNKAQHCSPVCLCVGPSVSLM